MNKCITLVAAYVFATTASAYPEVSVTNETERTIRGWILYPGCAPDFFLIHPHNKWTSPYRGGCLITQIHAHWEGDCDNLEPPECRKLEVFPYESSGTGYACFVARSKQAPDGKRYPAITRCGLG